VFAGQSVGIKEVGEQVRLVSLMQHSPDISDQETGRVNQRRNPLRAKVLPMCPE
jgi:putative transposase